MGSPLGLLFPTLQSPSSPSLPSQGDAPLPKPSSGLCWDLPRHRPPAPPHTAAQPGLLAPTTGPCPVLGTTTTRMGNGAAWHGHSHQRAAGCIGQRDRTPPRQHRVPNGAEPCLEPHQHHPETAPPVPPALPAILITARSAGSSTVPLPAVALVRLVRWCLARFQGRVSPGLGELLLPLELSSAISAGCRHPAGLSSCGRGTGSGQGDLRTPPSPGTAAPSSSAPGRAPTAPARTCHWQRPQNPQPALCQTGGRRSREGAAPRWGHGEGQLQVPPNNHSQPHGVATWGKGLGTGTWGRRERCGRSTELLVRGTGRTWPRPHPHKCSPTHDAPQGREGTGAATRAEAAPGLPWGAPGATGSCCRGSAASWHLGSAAQVARRGRTSGLAAARPPLQFHPLHAAPREASTGYVISGNVFPPEPASPRAGAGQHQQGREERPCHPNGARHRGDGGTPVARGWGPPALPTAPCCCCCTIPRGWGQLRARS